MDEYKAQEGGEKVPGDNPVLPVMANDEYEAARKFAQATDILSGDEGRMRVIRVLIPARWVEVKVGGNARGYTSFIDPNGR